MMIALRSGLLPAILPDAEVPGIYPELRMQYGFIIDNRKCIDCHACTVACNSEHDVPIGVNRTWVKYI